MVIIRLLSLLFFFCLSVHAQECVTVSFGQDREQHRHELALFLPEKCFIGQIILKNDFRLSPTEFFYLTELKEQSYIDASILEYAVYYLFQKQKIESIEFRLVKTEKENKLMVTLTSFWSFRGLSIKGILYGKDVYKNKYVLETGMPFDKEKHNFSLEQIKKQLFDEGYCDAQLNSFFYKNDDYKTIDTEITIKKGSRFSIFSQEIELVHKKENRVDKVIKNNIATKFLAPLQGQYFKEARILQTKKKIIEWLEQLGYWDCLIDTSYRKENYKIIITWKISIGNPRKLIFFGNNFFSSAQLFESLSQFSSARAILPASIMKQEIEKLYKKCGFWHVEITLQEEEQRLVFVIKECERAFLQEVELVRSSNALLVNKVSEFLQSIIYEPINQEKIDSCIEQLKDWFLKNGYLDFVIHDQVYGKLSKKGNYKLMLDCSPGQRYWIKTSILEGEIETVPWITKAHTLKPGLFYAQNIEKQREEFVRVLKENGFVHAQVKLTISRLEDLVDSDSKIPKKQVEVRWSINPGKPLFFGKTILIGPALYPYNQIMKGLRYQQGKNWDSQTLKDSFLALKQYELFDTLQFMPKQDFIHSDQRMLLLTALKDNPYELRLRGGLELQQIRQYKTMNGIAYKAGGTFIIKDPFNAGDSFFFNVDLARYHREVIAKYVRPTLFSTSMRLVTQLYSIKHEQPSLVGAARNIYTITQNGFLMGLFNARPFYEWSCNIGLEWDKTSLNSIIAQNATHERLIQFVPFNAQILNKQIPYFFIEPSFYIDRLDNKLNPHNGSLLLATSKGMTALQKEQWNLSFLKLLFEHSWFASYKDIIAAFRVRFGHIFTRSILSVMPLERFYLGGAHSVRSYGTDLVPPLSVVNEVGHETIIPVGAQTLVNTNLELRFPIYGQLGGVLFQDFGFLSSHHLADFSLKKVAAGTGFGFRYYTPLGPLSLDIAFKWRKDRPQEPLYAWFLYFGHAF